MKLINQAKTKFITSKGLFKVNSIVDFEESEARTLLKYEGVNSIESLEEAKPVEAPAAEIEEVETEEAKPVKKTSKKK